VVYNDGSRIRVEDRASLNGTFVNHHRVEKQELQTGDEIQIGKYKLTYVAETA
jgi:pSer/pThr/pTyr-binding forkhead associated (FHA) protein